MAAELVNIGLVFLAGLASVASPCVLPVVPIIVTGGEKDHRLRPVLIVTGISIAFILMGVVTSLFGAAVGPKIAWFEKGAGVLVVLFGLLMFLDVNLFKKLTVFNRISGNFTGPWGGLVMGLTLGLVWIPCIGPMLSGVLAKVATDGQLGSGVFQLSIYALGFSVPMLVAGYASQAMRSRVNFLAAHPVAVRAVSGTILVLFGVYILTAGILGFGVA